MGHWKERREQQPSTRICGNDLVAEIKALKSSSDHRVLDGRVLLVEYRPTGKDIPRA